MKRKLYRECWKLCRAISCRLWVRITPFWTAVEHTLRVLTWVKLYSWKIMWPRFAEALDNIWGVPFPTLSKFLNRCCRQTGAAIVSYQVISILSSWTSADWQGILLSAFNGNELHNGLRWRELVEIMISSVFGCSTAVSILIVSRLWFIQKAWTYYTTPLWYIMHARFPLGNSAR